MKLFQKLCDKISPFLKTNNLHYIVNDKKNYYLPKSNMHFLPKSNIIHYLPLSKKKIVESLPIILKNIPGTWTPRPSFYDSAKADKDINKIINFIIIELLSKEPIYTPYELAKAIKRILYYPKSLHISEDYYYPIVQHILVSIFPHIKISKKILKLISQDVNFESFPEYVEGPLSIIEAHILQLTLGKFLVSNKDKIKIFAQDHKNIKNLDEFKIESYKQTGQPYADYRLEIVSHDKLIFLDIKLKMDPVKNVNLLKGSLSLTTKKIENLYLVKIQGDLPSSINQKETLGLLSIKEKLALEEIKLEINKINSNKNITLETKFNSVLQLVRDSYLNFNINNLTFSVIMENSINDTIIVEDNAKDTNLNNDMLFPKDGKTINIYEWKNIYANKVLAISENHSNDIKQLIIDNYNRIELF